MGHQIHKTQTIIVTLQARLEDLTDVAAEIYGISLLQNWQTESWTIFCLLKSPMGSLLRTESTCNLRLSIVCVEKNNAIANEASTAKLSEVWDPMTFTDKFDITGRPVQFHWHILSALTAIQIMREILTLLGPTKPCDFKARIVFMLMFNDIQCRILYNQQKCRRNATEVTEHAKQVELGHCGFWTRTSMVSPVPEHANGAWDHIARNIHTNLKKLHNLFSLC